MDYDLHKLFERARKAVAWSEHISPGFEAGRRVAAPAVETGVFDIREMTVPVLSAIDGQPVLDENKVTTLDAAVMENSRVGAAGANLLISKNVPMPQPKTDAGLALYEDLSQMRLVKPAKFSALSDGASTSETGLPVSIASVNWSGAPNYSFRTRISRRTQRGVGGPSVEDQIMHAISLGLARQADYALLNAIVVSSPTAFSLAKAAAAGLKFSDLRALVGTSAIGATINAEGNLQANGVTAELTDTIAGSVIGAFVNAGVIVHPDVQVIVERASAVGDLVVTVHVAIQALIPDTSLFWMGV